MFVATTDGIKIYAEVVFSEAESQPKKNNYLFAYRITIENNNTYDVQLLARHWYIFDSAVQHREIEGEGVVGKQPIIATGAKHQYVSGCGIHSDLGTMHGYYTMKRIFDNSLFEAQIPTFVLITPDRLN